MSDLENKAMEIQGKFEFYIVGLNFTVLALAIQSANFGAGLISNVIELLSWVALLVAGIKGLLRIQFIPVVLRYYAAKAIGQDIDESNLEKIEGKVSSRMYIWLFVLGLILLAVSRANIPITQIVEYVRGSI